MVAVLVLPMIAVGRSAAAREPLPQPMETFADPAGQVDDPQGIVAGPDGNLWFTSAGSDRIGRITPSGVITTFPDPAGQVDDPRRITVGPDGALWFTSFGSDRIGRITTGGEITTYVDPSGGIDGPHGITAGPDGNLWFTSSVNHRIGRITTTGTVTTFDDPPGLPNQISMPWGITAGPDGNLWYTNRGSSVHVPPIGRITPAGAITMFKEPGPSSIAQPLEITAGPDGNLWFTGGSGNFGLVSAWRLTTGGVFSRFFVSENGFPATNGVGVGPDGNVWFTESYHDMVGRVTPGGVITTFSDRLGNGESGVVVDLPVGVTGGPDGAVWFTSSGTDRIGRLALGPSLAGRVSGPANAPIGEAWVLAVASDGSSVRGALTSRADTSGDGRYELFVDPGSYLVEFVDPSGDHAGEWHDDRPLWDLGQATPVSVNGPGVTIDASLAAAGYTGAFAGTLTASGGGPAPGVWVAAFDLGAARVAGTAVTAADGPYRIGGLAAGGYLVGAADPTLARAASLLNGSVPVSVSAGTTTTVGAALGPAPTAPPVAGSLSGTVSSAAGPLAGVWVAAVDANTGRFAGGTVTGGSGSYTLGVPAGNFLVEFVDPSGAHGAEWNHDRPVTGLADADPVTIGAGEVEVIDAVLAASGPTGSIAGTVTAAEAGGPVAGAWVAAIRAADGRFVGGGVAGVDGAYTIERLDTGSYVVVVIDPTGALGFEFQPDATSFVDAVPVDVSAGATTTVDAELDPL